MSDRASDAREESPRIARERRVRSLLGDVIDLDSDARRRALDERRSREPEIVARVERLLRADAESGSFLEVPAIALASDALATPGIDQIAIDGYRIESVIETGGMSTVFRARQLRPPRAVAIKVLHPALFVDSARRRFEREAEILASLRHPNIAAIHEVGTCETPLGAPMPFIAMELVEDARSITRFVREESMSRTDRVRLFLSVCDAVAHGHDNGVIHRDLKPGNVLIGSDRRPRVIDFGIAVGIGDDGAFTREMDRGRLLGTLAWMSPEQVRGERVDVRADVYALGALLYEILLERRPRTIEGLSITEALRHAERSAPPRALSIDPTIGPDLDAILAKSLATERELRYPGVRALAEDLRRTLRHEPIEARPPTLITQARLFARRQRALVNASVAVALVLVVASILAGGSAWRATREADRRRDAEAAALRERDAAIWKSYVATVSGALSSNEAREIARARLQLENAPPDLRGWEWRFARTMVDRTLVDVRAHAGDSYVFAATPDRTRFVTAARDGEIAVRTDAESDPIMTTKSSNALARTAALSRGGDLVAVANDEGMIDVWSVTSGERLVTFSHGSRVDTLAFDGADRLLAAGSRGVLRRSDPRTGEPIDGVDGADPTTGSWRVGGAVVCPDGEGLLTWEWTGATNVLAARAEFGAEPVRIEIDARPLCAAVSDDARFVAIADVEGSIAVHELATGHLLMKGPLSARGALGRSIAFDPAGTRIAVGLGDRFAYVLSLEDTTIKAVFRGHEDVVCGVMFHADGTALTTLSWDGSIRVWTADPAESFRPNPVLAGATANVRAVAFADDCGLLLSACDDGHVQAWDVGLEEEVARFADLDAAVRTIAVHPDGRSYACAGADGTIAIRSLIDGSAGSRVQASDDDIWSLAFSPDGRLLASGGDDGVARIHRLDDPDALIECAPHDARVTSVSFSPDGTLLATTSRDSTVRLIDSRTGRTRHELEGHRSDVFASTFSLDGSRLFTGSRDRSIRVWDVASGAPIHVIDDHAQFITALSLSPDGARVMATSWFGELIVLDADRCEVVASVSMHEAPIRGLDIAHDGRAVATSAIDGSIRIPSDRTLRERVFARTRDRAAIADARAAIAARAEVLGSLAAVAREIEASSSRDPEARAVRRRALLGLVAPPPPIAAESTADEPHAD